MTDPVALLKPLRDKIVFPRDTPINKDDELAELSNLPGTRCRILRDQLLLLEPGHEQMVTVINVRRVVICSAAKAATFNLFPEES